MATTAVFIACSLDGFIADREGGLEWLEAAAGSEVDHGFDAFLADVDAVAMGRGTYDVVAGFDALPYGERQLFVFTHRPPEARPGVTFWSLEPAAAVDEWDRLGLRKVYVDGGRLISDFLGAGLVDEMTVTIVPVLLGGGHRLFHEGVPRRSWECTGVRQFPTGLVSLSYRRR